LAGIDSFSLAAIDYFFKIMPDE